MSAYGRIVGDLLDDLLATLGPDYAIERELKRQFGFLPVEPIEVRHIAVPMRTFVVRSVSFGWRAFVRVLTHWRPELLWLREFKNEIDRYAHLRHENILSIDAVGAERGNIFYTMRYVDGKPLSERLARGRRLPIPDVVRITHDVAAALSYSHSHKAVHRALASASIFVDAGSGHAFVTDFGVTAGYMLADGGTRADVLSIFGEWPRGERWYKGIVDPDVDRQSDLHSLGVIAYRMLSASYPTRAHPPVRFGREPIAPLPSIVQPALRELVMALLEERVEDRPQSADEVLDALDALSSVDANRGER
jgi:serine/threonine protein kinase